MAFQGWAAAVTTGGAGGTIIMVTNLNNSGAGSFRAAIEATYARIIRFAVSGVIDFENISMSVNAANGNLSIEGESAPGNGISFKRGRLLLANCENVIVTHFRSRVGTGGLTSGYEPDGISTDNAKRIIIDHCSIAWAIDELLSISGPSFSGATPIDWQNNTSSTITVSNCIISEPLNNSIHSSGIHGYGSLLFAHVHKILFINNLWASCQHRTPIMGGGHDSIALVNNVIYNTEQPFIFAEASASKWLGKTPVQSYLNVVGNVAIIGPNANVSPLFFLHNADEVGTHYNLWFDDNIALGTQFLAGRTIKDQSGNLVQTGARIAAAWDNSIVTMDSSLVFDYVMENVGAYPDRRDVIDTRIINNVKNGTHSIIDNEEDVGGYDTVGVMPMTKIGKLGHTEIEKEIWRSRIRNSIYTTNAGAPSYVPWGGGWDRILNGDPNDNRQHGAIYFKDNWNTIPIWDGDMSAWGSEPYEDIAHGIKDAALHYFIYGDITFANACTSFLKKQFAVAATDFSNDFPYFIDTPYFKTAKWLSKLLKAWGMVSHTASTADRAYIDDYFLRHAIWYKDSVHDSLIKLFPNRRVDDYLTRAGDASNSAKNNNEFTHQTSTGVKGNQIYTVHKWFNNRRADAVGFFGLAGILYENSALKADANRFYKEWVKYSMFPDGTTGEYERNGDYSLWASGITYNAITLQHAVTFADALARNGDSSLYEYTSSEGIYGTEGGPKSIKLGIERLLKHVDSSDVWYYGNEYKFGGVIPVEDQYKLDLVDSNDANKQWLSSIYCAPLANQFYQEPTWKDIYTHQAAGTIPYTGKYGTAGDIWYPFMGTGAIFPDIMFMFAEMESLNLFNTPVPLPVLHRIKTKGIGSHYLNSRILVA